MKLAKKSPVSHYSPVFTNKLWADEKGYISFFSCPHTQTVKKSMKGIKHWGRQRGLYTWAVENALNTELENDAAIIYNKILSCKEINLEERIVWAQFILSQLTRTPTYIRYENFVKSIFNITDTPAHDRVGCKECTDLNFVANRDWCLLVAHKDDYFVRTDNPVLQTGFVERPESCLFYPLSPRLCFVACSMAENWDAFFHIPNETNAYELEKGAAHMINFYLAKAAGQSLIISPKHDGLIAERMFSEVLGEYPQVPFSLHTPRYTEFDEAYKSIQNIMSQADGLNYPSWEIYDLEPFYQRNNENYHSPL